MKKKLLIFVLSIIGITGFLYLNKQYSLTDYKIPLFSVPYNRVRIDFVNNSDESIKLISLSTSDDKIKNLKIGERKTITFRHKGEGTYQFIIDFDSGKQIIEGERYIERGYFITEIIYNNEVKTNY